MRKVEASMLAELFHMYKRKFPVKCPEQVITYLSGVALIEDVLSMDTTEDVDQFQEQMKTHASHQAIHWRIEEGRLISEIARQDSRLPEAGSSQEGGAISAEGTGRQG